MNVTRPLLKVGPAAFVTVAIVVAAALVLWRTGWIAHLMSGQPAGDSLIGDIEGEVWAIEPAQTQFSSDDAAAVIDCRLKGRR